MITAGAIVSWAVPDGQAAEACKPVVARIVSLQGRVEVQSAGSAEWTRAALDDQLCVGDAIRAGAFARAALALTNDSVLSLDQLTTMRLGGEAETGRSLLDLLLGEVHFFSHRPRSLEIVTPIANAGTEGTEFLMRARPDRTEVMMFEGRVRLQTPAGELLLASGDAAVAVAGAAPQPEIVARPRDAVAWSLYYPPILAPLAERRAAPATLPPALQQAVERVAANDYEGAIAALDAVPEAARDARYYTYRAGVLLNVGRADEAAQAIDRALALDPKAADALAQRAVIAVVQNRREDALKDARQAVELNPNSAPARIALSYALQASFDLDAARATLREAAERTPDDALVQARARRDRALVRQSQCGAGRGRAGGGAGARSRADPDGAGLRGAHPDRHRPGQGGVRAGDRSWIRPSRWHGSASALPRSARATSKPAGASSRSRPPSIPTTRCSGAISARPTSRSGAILRMGEQYEIAKQLDPNDPTPWFYDAIRLQTINRPVEALHNIEKSIELNDNRAPYRSRLLLDEDLAVRQTSLARIYNDLGFEQVALTTATKSLNVDPANYSAHRFLSDTYAALPRHEIARASELLQSQLLQPININPVQPSLPLTDFNIVTGAGPAQAAFNEFTPLFASNGAQLNTTGVVGNHDTYGGEGVASMIYGRTSLSVGGSGFTTDGFRANNDDTTKLADAYAQVAVTPNLNLQAEYRYRDTDQGDLDLNFDPDSFAPDNRLDINQNTARLGLRYGVEPQADILASFIYSQRTEDQTQVTTFDTPGGPLISDTDIHGDDTGYQGEAQYLFRRDLFRITAGVGGYATDSKDRVSRTVTLPNGVIGEGPGGTEFGSEQQQTGYIYGYLDLPKNVSWTLGMGGDFYQRDQIDIREATPKLGVQWQITDALRLRAAFTRTVKRALVVNQTIEPTEVAGFNQFFDDVNGTKADRVGIGLDARLSQSLYAGVEASHRELDVPVQVDNSVNDINQNEDLVSGYLYWVPLLDWAFTADVLYDQFRSDEDPAANVPREVQTFSVPVFAHYFSPTGLFGVLGATFVHQEVERNPGSVSLAEGQDDFVVVDAAMGYRLPKRIGVVSLEGRNLLDENFQYQDDNFRIAEPTSPRFIPERSVLVRVTLSF